MTASPLAGNDRLAIHVSPSIAFAPANLSVRAMVEADKANGSIEVIAESSEFYRSSEIQLDGEHAPRTTMFQFRAVPSGDYLVRAVLRDNRGGEITFVQSQVNVMSTQPGY